MSLLLASTTGTVTGRFVGDLPAQRLVWSPDIQTWTFSPGPGFLLPPFRQRDWPLPLPQFRQDQSLTVTYNPNLVGKDQLPPGETIYDLAPGQRPPPPENLKTWLWSYNLNLIGKDRLPVGYKLYELWTPAAQRAINLSSWEWRNVQFLGKDSLTVGAQLYDLPPGQKPLYPENLKTWTWWYNLNLVGQDKLPPGAEFTELPPQPLYHIQLRTWLWNWIMITTVAGPMPFAQLDWPLTPAPKPLDQFYGTSYNWKLIGQDQLPFRQQDWPIWRDYERSIQLRTWIDTTKLLLRGQDQLPFRQQDWPVPRDHERSIQLRTWTDYIQQEVSAAQPFNQEDWPNPRDHERSIQLRTWLDLTKFWLIPPPSPFNQFDWPLTPAAKQAALSWIANYSLNLIGKDKLPINQYDWPLPNRGPAPIEQTTTYRNPFAAEIPFVGAQYFLLQPHFILNRWIDAWTTVTEGVEIPLGWVPTPAVDPLNAPAVTAFYNAGPRTAWLGPEWSWQNYQNITFQRQNIMLVAATRWTTTGNGFYSLTGLGTGLPPVGV